MRRKTVDRKPKLIYLDRDLLEKIEPLHTNLSNLMNKLLRKELDTTNLEEAQEYMDKFEELEAKRAEIEVKKEQVEREMQVAQAKISDAQMLEALRTRELKPTLENKINWVCGRLLELSSSHSWDEVEKAAVFWSSRFKQTYGSKLSALELLKKAFPEKFERKETN